MQRPDSAGVSRPAPPAPVRHEHDTAEPFAALGDLWTHLRSDHQFAVASPRTWVRVQQGPVFHRFDHKRMGTPLPEAGEPR